MKGLLPALLLAAIALAVPSVAAAETGAWSKPVVISGNVGGSFPDIAVDGAGNVHVVWNGTLPGQSGDDLGALFYTRWNGSSWSEPNDVALISPSSQAIFSSIVAGPGGQLGLVYKGMGRLTPDSLTQDDLWFTTSGARQTASVASWTTPARITRDEEGDYADLAVDSHGVIHLIWMERSADAWTLEYAHSTDGGATWSKPVALDETGDVWPYRAHLQVDRSDRLHVVWELAYPSDADVPPGTTRAAVYAVSTDSGRSWTTTMFPSAIPPDPPVFAGIPGPQQPAIGVDGNGNVLLVYREYGSDRILYRRSSDGVAWTAPAPLPGVAKGIDRPYDVYDLATDSAGHVHLVMVAEPTHSNVPSLLHSEWNGHGWGLPTAIATSPPYPEYPKIAIGQGNRLHVVWFDGDRATIDRTPIGISYSTALTDAPRVVSRPTVNLSASTAALTPVSHPSPTPAGARRLGIAPVQAAPASGAATPWRPDLGVNPQYPIEVAVLPIILLLAVIVAVKRNT